jgi:type III pantothenate kinase
MVLTINVGNTNITVGGYTQDTQYFCGRICTDLQATVDEYAIRLQRLLALYHADTAQIDGAIVGSVVPALTERILSALHLLTPARVLTVGPGLKSGLRLCIENPAQLGADLLCGVVAALNRAPGPVVVVSVDTALAMMAANARRELIGGAFLPGPQLSLAALVRNTAQLPQVDLYGDAPDSVLGKSTAACLRSGVILGTASLLDGMAARFTDVLGPDTRFFATGSLPEPIRTACRTPMEYCDSLIPDGLYVIWQRNRR